MHIAVDHQVFAKEERVSWLAPVRTLAARD